MLKEFYTAALGMLNQQTRLEVTANNIANANTTGFKRASVFERNLQDARANLYNVQGDAEQNDPPIGSYYDFSDGSFTQTDNPLDVALDGNGFFVVQDDDGKEFLTRNGNFKLSQDGEIVTMDGKKLMGEEGSIKLTDEFYTDPLVTRDSKSMDIKIAPTGEVFAGDSEIGKIRVENVENPESLQRISNQDFLETENTISAEDTDSQTMLRQGWLEGSNVNIVREMVDMIELQRMYEAGSKVIQTNDSTLDRSIYIGRFV